MLFKSLQTHFQIDLEPTTTLAFLVELKQRTIGHMNCQHHLFLGTNVKDTTIIDHLQNNQNWIINQFGEESVVLIQERGQVFSFKIGKIFNVIGPNPNSGLIIKLGIGWMRHKIRIDNENDQIPQLSQQHLPYYDRLASGLNLYQFIGYHHMSNNRLTNFFLGTGILSRIY